MSPMYYKGMRLASYAYRWGPSGRKLWRTPGPRRRGRGLRSLASRLNPVQARQRREKIARRRARAEQGFAVGVRIYSPKRVRGTR